MTIAPIISTVYYFFKQPDFPHLLPLEWSHKPFPSIHLLCFLDTFIHPPVPLSSFLRQAPREIVFFTFLMKAARSCSPLSGFSLEEAGVAPSHHMLIYVHDIHPFSALDNRPFTKWNSKIKPVVGRAQGQGPVL